MNPWPAILFLVLLFLLCAVVHRMGRELREIRGRIERLEAK